MDGSRVRRAEEDGCGGVCLVCLCPFGGLCGRGSAVAACRLLVCLSVCLSDAPPTEARSHLGGTSGPEAFESQKLTTKGAALATLRYDDSHTTNLLGDRQTDRQTPYYATRATTANVRLLPVSPSQLDGFTTTESKLQQHTLVPSHSTPAIESLTLSLSFTQTSHSQPAGPEADPGRACFACCSAVSKSSLHHSSIFELGTLSVACSPTAQLCQPLSFRRLLR